MATKRWIGGAVAVAQVQTYQLAGTWETDDIIRIKIGSKIVDFTVGSATIATAIDTVLAAYNALDETLYPEFAEMTASRTSTDKFTLTKDSTGIPFVATLTPVEANGSAADAQTIEGAGVATTGTAATANAGPYAWSTAANWDTGAIPVNGDDVYLAATANDCLYGIDQNGVTLASLNLDNSFTGSLGLPESTGTYPEYRDIYLKISATAIRIGYGPGSASQRIRLNVGTVQCTMDVLDSGTSSETGLETILFRGTHASNVVNVTKGSLGIAVKPGETSTVATLRVGFRSNVSGDSAVRCGSGVTLTTVEQAGGELEISSNITTLTKTDGNLIVNGTATATTYNIDGGTVYHRSSGTVTTVKIGDGGALDFSQDMRARTVTNCTLTKGSALRDPFRTVTFTNPFTLNRCAITDVELDVGIHRTIQVANAA